MTTWVSRCNLWTRTKIRRQSWQKYRQDKILSIPIVIIYSPCIQWWNVWRWFISFHAIFVLAQRYGSSMLQKDTTYNIKKRLNFKILLSIAYNLSVSNHSCCETNTSTWIIHLNHELELKVIKRLFLVIQICKYNFIRIKE